MLDRLDPLARVLIFKRGKILHFHVPVERRLDVVFIACCDLSFGPPVGDLIDGLESVTKGRYTYTYDPNVRYDFD